MYRGSARTAMLRVVGCLACAIATSAKADIHHVDALSPGGDGSDWSEAYRELQSALAIALPGDEVWVAEGTYRPDYDFLNGSYTNDEEATFQLLSGVAVYGGFPSGGGDGTFDARDPDTYTSSLTGNIGMLGSDGDNSDHIVTGTGADATAVLDGFVILRGVADGGGDDNRGAGMINDPGNPTVSRCRFIDNTASNGAAIFNRNSSPTISFCEFTANSASSLGGAIYNEALNGTGAAVVLNSAFHGNSAGSGGAIHSQAVFSADAADVVIASSIFSGNTASNNGGAIYNDNNSPTIVNVTVTANSAFNSGGGIYASDGHPTIINSIVWGNVDGGLVSESDEIFLDDADGAVRHNIIGLLTPDGEFDSGSNLNNFDADPLFVRNPDDGGDGWGDGKNDDYGDLHLLDGSPAIDAGNTMITFGAVDLDGTPRAANDPATADTGITLLGRVVDLGAYEIGAADTGSGPDLDGDGDVDLVDYMMLQAAFSGPAAP